MGIINYIGDPANWPKIKIVFYISLAVVFAADFLVERHHAETWWDKTPGWSAFYGFVSCVFLIFIVKFIGHIWLYKKEDYYD
jgi:uncharacterized membrane protein